MRRPRRPAAHPDGRGGYQIADAISLSALALASLRFRFYGWVWVKRRDGRVCSAAVVAVQWSFIAVVIIWARCALWHLPLFRPASKIGLALSLFPVRLIFTWIFIHAEVFCCHPAHVAECGGSMFFSPVQRPGPDAHVWLRTADIRGGGIRFTASGPAARQTFDESPTRELD